MPRKLKREAVERTYASDGSVRAEDLPYDAAADIKTSLDSRTPPDIGASDDGKLSQAYYTPPPVYGDGSEGDVTISVETQINSYTHMTADALIGATTINVATTTPVGETPFAQGDEVCLVQTQCFRDTTKRFRYEFRTIDSVTSNTITFTTGLSKAFDSDASGNKANNTMTQVVRVPNYGLLTLNANIIPKPWDGESGGYLIYRASELAGAGHHDLTGCGFRGYTYENGNAAPRGRVGEGPLGKGADLGAADPGDLGENAATAYWPNHPGVQWHATVPGHFTAGGPIVTYAPITTEVFLGAGLYTSDGVTPLTADDVKGGLLTLAPGPLSGVSYYSGNFIERPSSSAGSMLAYVNVHTGYTGEFQAGGLSENAYLPDLAGAGGLVVLYSATSFTNTTDVSGGTAETTGVAGSGLVVNTTPSILPTKGFQHGPKVTTDPALAAGNDIIPKSAVETLIAASNPGYSTTFVDGDLVAGVLTVTHNLGQQVLQVMVADNNGEAVSVPITFIDNNNLSLDLSVLGTITGTWTVAVGTGGRDIASLMRASTINIGGADHNVEENEAGYLIEIGDDTLGRTLTIRDFATHPVTPNNVWLVSREGTESVTIQAAAGVTLNGVLGGAVTITDQYGEVAIRAKDPANDIWRVTGNYTQV